MADDSPLLRLPDVTMSHVLYFCDYREIARLRKVCHTLRNHIDLFKPDAHVEKVRLGNSEEAEIFLESDNDSIIWIDYKETEGGCIGKDLTDIFAPPPRTLSGLDPMDALIQDFNCFLRHMNGPLRKFTLEKFCCDALHQIMRSQPPESRIFPLNVDTLELYGLSAAQILATLPLFDANHLKDLEIEAETDELNEDAEDNNVFHALFETEHWRKAEKIWLLSNFKISNFRQILHLKEFRGTISRVTAADVEFLKNTFINSPLFEHILIEVDVDLDLQSIKDRFGEPAMGILNTSRWYLNIPNNSTRVLKMIVTRNKIFEIFPIDRSKIFPGSVINY